MNYRFYAKKLGDNWYLDIKHIDAEDIAFNRKINLMLNLFDVDKTGYLEIDLSESWTYVPDNAIYIYDDDLLRYFTTDDTFDVRFIVRDIELSISSDMYSLIESQYNPNFHKTLYTIEIRNRTI